MCGKGVWRKLDSDPNSDTYEGEYLDDKKHGYGEFKWQSGGWYKGFYAHDLKQGYGEMHWADGSIYRGTWDKGVQNGLGIITFANGTRKAGIFQDNKLLELLTDKKQIISSELLLKMQFPKNFKQELKDYVSKLNPTENNQEYLNQNHH